MVSGHLSTIADGNNGVYHGTPGSFPNLTNGLHTNYYADVRFDATPITALFSDNFNDNSLGAAWSTYNGTWSESGQILQQTSTASQDPKKAIVSNSSVTFPANLTITAKVRVDTWTDGTDARAGVSLFTNTSDGCGYNLVFADNHSTVRFLNDSIGWSSNYTFNWSTGTWYWFKLKMENGTLYGKVWQDGTTEPGTWPYSQAWSGRSGYPALNGSINNSTVSFDDVTVSNN